MARRTDVNKQQSAESKWNVAAPHGSMGFQPVITAGRQQGGSARAVGPLVDLGLVRGWLQTCEERHGDKCSSPSWLNPNTEEERPSSFRVIDVRDNLEITG